MLTYTTIKRVYCYHNHFKWNKTRTYHMLLEALSLMNIQKLYFSSSLSSLKISDEIIYTFILSVFWLSVCTYIYIFL